MAITVSQWVCLSGRDHDNWPSDLLQLQTMPATHLYINNIWTVPVCAAPMQQCAVSDVAHSNCTISHTYTLQSVPDSPSLTQCAISYIIFGIKKILNTDEVYLFKCQLALQLICLTWILYMTIKEVHDIRNCTTYKYVLLCDKCFRLECWNAW